MFSGTDIAHYVDMKSRKLLTRYTPAAAATTAKRLQNIDPDGYYHVVNLASLGLIYNTDKVSAAEAPKSWAALTDPKWKGQVSVGHPGFSGFVGVWCIEMRRLYGDGWFKKLAANKPQVGRSIIDTVTTVNSGERMISGRPAQPRRAAGGERQSARYRRAGRRHGGRHHAVGDPGQRAASERRENCSWNG